MSLRVLRFRKAVFLVICVCTASFMLYNEMTLQYSVKYRAQRHSLTMLSSPELDRTLRSNPINYYIEGPEEVIMPRSLTQTNKSAEEMSAPNNTSLTKDSIDQWLAYNYTSLTENSFDRWLAYNSGNLVMFTFSAVTSNVSFEGYSQSIIINGWEGASSRRTLIKCCFMWNNMMKTYYTNPNRTYFQKLKQGLSAVQVYCPLKSDVRDVKGVALEYKSKNCPTESLNYVKPSIAVKQKNGTLAICGKIFYNNINVKLIIEWVEYYRQMKADKIVIYTYNLTKKAEAVIQYYAQTGFVETGQFDFPLKTGKKREVGTKNPAAWMDEQVVVFDCFERLKGYTYFSIVDLDEFILPRKHTDLKAMIAGLMKNNPMAAGFSFHSHLFIKDWGKVETNNGSDIEQYLNRTVPIYTRQKNILLPERIKQGSIHTHTFKQKPGFKTCIVNSNTAVINHYRSCYANFIYRCMHTKQFTDRSILKFSEKSRERKAVLLKRFT